MQRLTFNRFMRQFRRDDTAFGDFARDVLRDRAFPWRATPERMREYLSGRGACAAALETFDRAVKAWNGEIKWAALWATQGF